MQALFIPCLHVLIILTIMQACPCNEHPLTPHFYIVKLGTPLLHSKTVVSEGVYIVFCVFFFLNLCWSMDGGCMLEPPQ